MTDKNRVLRIVLYVFTGLLALVLVQGCGPEDEDPHEGATPLGPGPRLGKADGTGVKSLRVSGDYSSTRVWKVKNRWEDTDTAAAREAGITWKADSGLNWDEKFAHWIEQVEKINAHESTYSQTFKLTTPWGTKTLPAPSLDCADVWLFLRATFAAWYHLPFYLEAMDGSKRVFFGHFGVRTRSGRWGSMPKFAQYYKDYTYMAATLSDAELLEQWPEDSRLRKRGVGSGDEQPFLSEDARMGTYLDEVHLNKRAGHFIRLLMIYTGTPNLADSHNTYNLVPDALREGDALLYRRARNGSGHTMVVLRVGKTDAGKLTVEIASGNVPPRQPKWESQASSKTSFTDDEGGGPSQNSNGETYSHIGGGLKRFRVAKEINGYWVNTFMKADEASWLDDTDYDKIGARPKQFESLLGEVDPKDKRKALVKIITDAREHLRKYPASCAARERREKAFKALYMLNLSAFYKNKKETDKEYRKKEDYVFAQLVYEKSRTCCWNSSTAKMFEIIMDRVDTEEKAASTCAAPPVFMVKDDGYADFEAHAKTMGLKSYWQKWSADESCPQKYVVDDTEATHLWTPYCDLELFGKKYDAEPDTGDSGDGSDGGDGSDVF